MKITTFFLALLITTVGSAQNETCHFIGEISILSVESGAFLACTKSGNPGACAIALYAHNCGGNPSCEGVIKQIVEDGCNYTISVVGEKIKIVGKASILKFHEMKKTYDELNSVQGLVWIQEFMTGGQ